MPAAELDFWHDPGLATVMPEGLLPEVAEGTYAHFQRLDEKLRPVAAPGEAVPSIRFTLTPGHTPGHALHIESDGAALMSIGDAVADPFAAVERPDWRNGLNWDGDAAVASRRTLLERAADDRVRVFGFHMPLPGFGHLARQGDAFRWIPKKWVWNP